MFWLYRKWRWKPYRHYSLEAFYNLIQTLVKKKSWCLQFPIFQNFLFFFVTYFPFLSFSLRFISKPCALFLMLDSQISWIKAIVFFWHNHMIERIAFQHTFETYYKGQVQPFTFLVPKWMCWSWLQKTHSLVKEANE